jgi:hypothetical protein
MVEIPLPIPKLDDARATKIAQSDKWGAISRLASIFAAGVTTLLLTPLIIWGFATLQSNSITLNTHSNDITTIRTDVASIKSQDGADHDAITVLKVQMESVLDQISKLWQRPAKPTDKAP